METVGPITLTHDTGRRFRLDFGLPGVPPLTTDATAPLGQGQGPDSERLLMAAVANCLSASLAFFLGKFRNDDVPIRTRAEARLQPNDAGRWRVADIAVDIHLGVPAARLRLLDRALAQFEDHCVVTQSVRAAIPVDVRVFDADGVQVAPASSTPG